MSTNTSSAHPSIEALSHEELKNMIEQLQEENNELKVFKERYELSVLGSTDGIWDWDLEQNIVYFSPTWKSMLGYQDSEITASYETFLSLIIDEDKNKIDQAVNDYIHDKLKEFSVEIRMTHKNGTIRWILYKGKAVRKKDGKAIRMSGTHVDITESKQVELKLKELSLIAEQSQSGILLSDMNGYIEWANESYLSIFEIPFDKLYKNRSRDLFPVYDTSFIEGLTNYNQTNTTVEIQVETYLKNKKWISLTNTLILNEKNELIKQIEFVTDITERKTNELKIKQLLDLQQTVLDNIPGYVVCRDYDGQFLFANKQFADLFEKNPEEVIGLNDNHYGASESEIESYLIADRKVIETKQPVFIPSEVVLRKDGSRGIFESTKTPVHIFGADKGAVLIVAFDITERKKEELKQINKQKATDKFNTILINLYNNPIEDYYSENDFLKLITKQCANGLEIERVSIWEYLPDKLVCNNLFYSNENKQSPCSDILFEGMEDFYKKINDELSISINNLYENGLPKPIIDSYCKPLDIHSMIVIPIRFEGKLKYILFCEKLVQPKEWQEEEISFARSIAEVISLSIESFRVKETQLQLMNSNERLEGILNHSGDLAFVLDTDFIIKEYYHNENKNNLFYLPPSFFLNKHLDDLNFPSETLQKIKNSLVELLSTGTKQKIEYHLMLDNKTEWFELNASTIDYKLSKKTEIICVVEKITDKVTYQGELNRTTSLLNTTQNITRIGGWELEVKTGKIILTNEVYKIYEEDNDFPLTFDSTLQFYQKEDQFQIKKEVLKVIRYKSTFDTVLYATTRKGTHKWIRFTLNPYIVNDKVERVIGSVQDITETKRIEDELIESNKQLSLLQLFVKNTKDAIEVADESGQLQYINNQAAERLGINIQDIHNYHVRDFEPLFNKEGSWEKHVLELKSKESMTVLGHTINLKTGYKLPIEVTANHISIDGKGFIVGVLRDISERIKAEEEIRKAIIQAEIANKAKSEFLANMSHEIRTPLNGVIGFADLLMNSPLDETQKVYLKTIHQSAISLLDIISDILDFSKIEAGKLELNIEKININEIISQVIDIIKYQAQEKQLELLVHISPTVPDYIWVDSLRIKQILINLLGNAIKFTEAGEIELSIMALNQNDSNLYKLRFSVRDTGIGIDIINQQRIFNAFTQEDTSTTKRYGGSGLGLSISNKLLELMNGKLNIESESNKGSTFYFDLEVKAEKNKEFNLATNQIKSILLVDDNEHSLDILEDYCNFLKIKSTKINNGKKAIELSTTNQSFDAIFIDQQMPDINGIETVKRINDYIRSNQIHVILMNNKINDQELTLLTKQHQINYSITKPILFNHFFDTISTLNLPATVKTNEAITQQVNPTRVTKIQNTKLHIMVVEDNKVNMLLSTVVLKMILPNAEIIEAENGEIAVEKYKLYKPDLIFMDIQMPIMNGYESTKAIRLLETEERTPIIALTAGALKGDDIRCYEAGMDDYITKPIVKLTLENTINKWINQSNTSTNIQLIQNTQEDLHLNINYILENINQNQEFLLTFLPYVKDSIQDGLHEIKKAYSQQNLVDVKSIAHRTKGTAMSAFLNNLTAITKEFETIENTTNTKAIELLSQLEKEIKIITSQIEDYLKSCKQ